MRAMRPISNPSPLNKTKHHHTHTGKKDMADMPGSTPSPSPAAAQIPPHTPPQDGKAPAPGVHLLPTYQLRPREDEKFSPAAAQRVAEGVLVNELKGKVYEEERVTAWAVAIAEAVKQGVKAQNIPRYKVVVQVTLGEMREQGVRVASRCLWDPVTDNHASASFTNESLWCTILIFAVYME